MDELAAIICSFPALECLAVFVRCRQTDITNASHGLVLPPRLKDLHLELTSWGPIARWLTTLNEEQFPRIQSLHVDLIHQDEERDSKDFAHFFRRLGPSLRSLTLLSHHDDQDSWTPCFRSEC
jgi:hypothetical protein